MRSSCRACAGVLFCIATTCNASVLRTVAPHLISVPRLSSAAIANREITHSSSGDTLRAFIAEPASNATIDSKPGPSRLPVLILLHEFWGLNQPIAEKAQALASELGCICIAPDAFRGTSTSFVPRAIWLALTTPAERVDGDIEEWVRWAARQEKCNTRKLAVMGFCYGGSRALRYTTGTRPSAATVVWYGTPIDDPATLAQLRGPVCAIFGTEDLQIPQQKVDSFRAALGEAKVEHEVVSYYGAGHAFFKDMEQVRKEEMPVIAGWRLTTSFLRGYFKGEESFAYKRDFLEFMLAQEETDESVQKQAE